MSEWNNHDADLIHILPKQYSNAFGQTDLPEALYIIILHAVYL